MDRRASESLRIPSICLMENAGAGAARIAAELAAGRSGAVLCLCGPGGNGGDAMVVARHLAIAGGMVRVARIGPRPSGDAATQFEICDAMGLGVFEISALSDLASIADSALVVDGLYGTGLTRALDGVAAALVEAVNSARVPVLSLDIPSGLDCDTGEPLGPCVRARTTATFAAPKLGFANPSSRAWTGDVCVVGIGAPCVWPLPK